jgi:hypothetical protein
MEIDKAKIGSLLYPVTSNPEAVWHVSFHTVFYACAKTEKTGRERPSLLRSSITLDIL